MFISAEQGENAQFITKMDKRNKTNKNIWLTVERFVVVFAAIRLNSAFFSYKQKREH